ncbi:choline dehydrogenase [Rhodobium orientis]|uniref:Choline dehydrogenase n=1 Tax=Rhodobium orientis TaxID=34017 RepID=A0A327JLL6_9HYPH|nr:choline dehydrogenase [Rhodobium orientis]MBB4301948.1 choline dehydrogenase [Rhodobium orientis]MBK5950185.1 choline dehydrogenase [Rhodobium orientis]RAI27249.1 choline dehydrogenase [Rhodobium orientis]
MREGETFDFLVVGAGSAGSVLASRLTEDGTTTVGVIEFGGTDAGPLIQMPAALSYPMNLPFYDWGFQTEPEPHLGGRRLVCPRGKVIGGSSSINGMVYVRGHARDFDTWEEMGARGWGFRNVLPYFKRAETSHGGEDGWRGTDGPLHVTRGPLDNPLHHAFMEAGAEAGYGLTEDYNGSRQEGFGRMEMTIWKGRRWSAANAYLKPALGRKNLELMTRTFAHRIVFEDGRAVGVEVENGGGRRIIRARREVILAASAINSPRLLMLSGIGDGEHLQAHGISTRAHRPGVGQNLQDHLELYLQMTCLKPVSLYSKLNWVSKALIGARWMFSGDGIGASNQFESCAFVRSAAGVDYPDIQYHFLPVAIRYDGKLPVKAHGFQAHVGPMRSKSRGRVALTGPTLKDPPSILFNYMSHDDDWSDFRTCIRLTREIFDQPAFAPYRGEELTPGADKTSNEELDAYISEAVESAYHPCGTCRIGDADDKWTVVDPECRVVGVDGLRVIDSSIFPQITNGNLNGPTIMVGEKGADLVLGRTPLAAANAEPWINPDWAMAQR